MDMRKEIIQLLGKVKILQNSGSKINTKDLIVDQSEGNEVYRTKEKIRYQSKVADIHATGMRYDAKNQKIKLTGGVVGRYE
jgi:lipopolysaccharide export system protein LptA